LYETRWPQFYQQTLETIRLMAIERVREGEAPGGSGATGAVG